MGRASRWPLNGGRILFDVNDLGGQWDSILLADVRVLTADYRFQHVRPRPRHRVTLRQGRILDAVRSWTYPGENLRESHFVSE
jgi:hypothetical protein